ncbi:MAG: penicillin acylase family protein, partial [Longimicrobiales bacterium]
MSESPRLPALLAAIVLAGSLYLGVRGAGALPPLGPLLDPVTGVWAVAAGAELPESETVELPGLGDGVRVLYDDRGVPHIFASSAEDAARALGWVSARDRLFEMELRWRTAAGRLSELVGGQALEFDRSMRRLGLAWAGDREHAGADPDSREMREVEAYAQGVNAWIEGMGRDDLPLEYRILGARPAPWRPVYSVYFLKLMGWDLAYSSSMDLQHAGAAALVGREAADALFPVHSPIQEPIQPSDGEAGPRFLPVSLPPPGTRDTSATRVAAANAELVQAALAPLNDRRLVGPLASPRPEGELLVGSNNWAVAPERTAAGHALLAGDPHLALTLPSIWYEVHLVVPGELDVYGANMPSVPRIVIGFNRDVAWSFTNTGADVLDYYEEEVDDPEDPIRYRVDGAWRPLDARIEEIRGPDGEVLAVDTLYVTHRGPVIEEDGRYLSMAWTVLGAGAAAGPAEGEDRALRGIMEAGSVEEWLESMESYQAPAQNGIVADRSGTIAIRSNGLFPLHPDADGRDVEDGSRTASEWNGFWPVEDHPQAVSPAQGYLASANQEPLVPEAYPHSYLGASWTSPWRALRINGLLRADSAVTREAMGRYHLDPGSPRADHFVPAFLAAADRVTPAGRTGGGSDGSGAGSERGGDTSEVAGEETDAFQRAARLLAEWDRRYTLANERAVLFEYAMEALVDRTWDELERPRAAGVMEDAGDGGDAEGEAGESEGEAPDRPDRVATPSEAILLGLLDDPDSP